MNSNSNYETLYGVGLLDDLHNYFPALLYDSSSFGSVQDVLGYIQRQTRTRFDLFSYGLREYQGSHPSPPPVENSYHRIVRTSFGAVPATGLPSLSTLRRATNPVAATNPTDAAPQTQPSSSTVNTIQVELNHISTGEEEEEEEEETIEVNQTNTLLTNALLSLLQLPAAPLTRNYVLPNLNNGRMTLDQMIYGRTNMDQFLQPVVVRPTPEQIAANTTLGNLVSDTDHSCAICQDALTSEQEGRKLNACGHWFHKTCIDTWLQGNVHCPVCRHDIREPMSQTIRDGED